MMDWYEENAKLYPLKEGDKLECVATKTGYWTKAKIYTANEHGQICSNIGTEWFVSSTDIPGRTLFRRVDDGPHVDDAPATANLKISVADGNGNAVTPDFLRKLADMMEGK